MLEIENVVLEKNLYYRGELILKYTISYPRIISNLYIYSTRKFNSFNRMIALSLKMYAEKDLFNESKEIYEYNHSNGYPIMVYELNYDFEITYNDNFILSLFSNEYIFTGGAHGSTVRKSQNWDMKLGEQFKLDSVFKDDPNYLLFILRDIIRQIELQIEQDSQQYFDNYCCLVLDTFNPNQFYLYDKNTIVIFFGQYDIAPYSSGIPTFKIPI